MTFQFNDSVVTKRTGLYGHVVSATATAVRVRLVDGRVRNFAPTALQPGTVS